MASSPTFTANDPHLVEETVCDGPMSVHFAGNRAAITFTHPRAKADSLLEHGHLEMELIVRARIATSLENMVALRDLLTDLISRVSSAPPAGTAGGTTKH
jgi:hypothetical protein